MDLPIPQGLIRGDLLQWDGQALRRLAHGTAVQSLFYNATSGLLVWGSPSPAFTNLNVSGWEYVGSLLAPTNTTAGDITGSRLILPDQTLPASFPGSRIIVNANAASAAGTPAIQVLDQTGNLGRIEIRAHGGIATANPTFRGTSSGGTIAAPTRTLTSQLLVALAGVGFDNAATPAMSGTQAKLFFDATEDWTTTAFGTKAIMQLTPVGSTTLTNYYAWYPAGHWIAGYVNVGALAAPTNVTAGDATFVRGFATTSMRVGSSTAGSNALDVTGVTNSTTGYQVNGAAASGNVLRGNGTNFVSAQLATTDISFPTGTTYTPTITPGAGSFTTVTGAGFYIQLGKLLYFSLTITQTNVGTGTGIINFSLPLSLTLRDSVGLSGRASAGYACFASGSTGSGVIGVLKYDGTSPIGNGNFVVVNGFVEVS